MSELHNDQLRILTSEDRLLVEAGNSTGDPALMWKVTRVWRL